MEAFIPNCKEMIKKFGKLKGLNDFLNELSGLGFELQIILSAASFANLKKAFKQEAYLRRIRPLFR